LELPAGLQFGQILTEPRLSQRVFGVTDWDYSFEALRPDVAVIVPGARFAILVENKTIGADLGTKGRQLRTGLELTMYLRTHSWKAESLFLLSVGYTNNRDLKLIRDSKVRIILWEDAFKLMNKIDRFRELFIGIDLSVYCNAEQSGTGWQG